VFLISSWIGYSCEPPYVVAHPELYWMDPDGDVMLVKDRKQGVALIDTASVTECVRLQPKSSSKKGRAGD
jgi:hypothetical protein